MRLPSKTEIGKLASLSRARERLAMVELAAVTARRNAAAARVRELRDRWPGNLVVKGVLDAEDALMLKQHGVDAVQVVVWGMRRR